MTGWGFRPAALQTDFWVEFEVAGEPHDLANRRISLVRDPDGNQIWLHQAKPR